MNKLFRKIFLAFVNGIVVILPIAVTLGLMLYPMNWLSAKISSFTNTVFRYFLNDSELEEAYSFNALLVFCKRYLPLNLFLKLKELSRIPYINLVFAALLVTFFGLIASNVLIQSGLKLLERVIVKVPVINLLYSYIKESMAAFVGKFDKPVLVTVDRALSIQKIGFITQENLQNFDMKADKVAVYVPHSYALSGQLYFFPKQDVQMLSISTTEAWKVILSGGLAEASYPKAKKAT